MSKPGRPKKIDTNVQQYIIWLIGNGFSLRSASAYAGVSLRTLQREIAGDKHFAILVNCAEQACVRNAVETIYQEASRNWRCAAWVLERHNPNDFAKRPASDQPRLPVKSELRAARNDSSPAESNGHARNGQPPTKGSQTAQAEPLPPNGHVLQSPTEDDKTQPTSGRRSVIEAAKRFAASKISRMLVFVAVFFCGAGSGDFLKSLISSDFVNRSPEQAATKLPPTSGEVDGSQIAETTYDDEFCRNLSLGEICAARDGELVASRGDAATIARNLCPRDGCYPGFTFNLNPTRKRGTSTSMPSLAYAAGYEFSRAPPPVCHG